MKVQSPLFQHLIASAFVLAAASFVIAQEKRASGDWPMWRHDNGISGYQPVPGAMKAAPRIVAKYFLGASPGASLPAELRADVKGDRVVWVRGQLSAYDASAQRLWISQTSGYDIDHVLWVDDLDGDGHNEVVAVAGHVGGNQQAYVIIDGTTGKMRGAIDIVTGDFGFRGKIGSFLPGTKGKQILVVTSAKQGESGITSNGEVALWAMKEGKGPEKLWSYVPPDFTLFYQHVMVAPMGPSGEIHAVIHSWCHVWNIDLASGRLINHETWDPHASSPRQYGWSELVDADGDGKLDYVNVSLTKHVDMLRNVDGQLKLAWTHGWTDAITTEQRALRPMCEPIVDLDGDGKQEVVAGLFDGLGDKRWHLYIWDAATGKQLSETMDLAPLATVVLDPKSSGRVMLCSRSKTVQFDPPETLEAWRFEKGTMTKLWEHPGVRLVQDAASETDRRVTTDTSLQTGFARTADCDGDGRLEFFTTDLHGGATRAWGLNSAGTIVEKTVPPPATPPSPSTVPALPALAGSTVPFLLAADIDGDERNELLWYDNTQLTIAKLDGETIKPIETIPSTEIPIVCDLLGDGHPAILSAGRVESRDLYVAARDAASKKEIWRYVFPESAGCGQYSDRPHFFTVGHFTGKKQLDVFTYSMKPQARAYVLDGKTGQSVWRKEEVGGIERHFQAFGGRSCVFDVNRDGADDLLFCNPDYYQLADGRTGELITGPVELSAVLHWWAAYSSPTVLKPRDAAPFVYLGGAYSSRASISIDGKQKLFREYLPTERWPLQVDGQRFTEGLLPPSKINGHWRVAYLESDGTLQMIEADTGKRLWSLPMSTAITAMVTADIDGDGEPELLFGGRDGNLYCIRDAGDKAQTVWRMSFGAPVASLIVADLNGDGKSDIAASVADGNIYVLHE